MLLALVQRTLSSTPTAHNSVDPSAVVSSSSVARSTQKSQA